MEVENLADVDYLNVLVQWLLFFGIVASILIPGFLFRRLALNYNRKGWIYFILGLGIIILGLKTGSLIDVIFRDYILLKINLYISALLVRLIIPWLFCWLCYAFLKKRFART